MKHGDLSQRQDIVLKNGRWAKKVKIKCSLSAILLSVKQVIKVFDPQRRRDLMGKKGKGSLIKNRAATISKCRDYEDSSNNFKTSPSLKSYQLR